MCVKTHAQKESNNKIGATTPWHTRARRNRRILRQVYISEQDDIPTNTELNTDADVEIDTRADAGSH
jgi:hypothetical protein